MPEYQPIEKNEKVAKRAIFNLATFRSGLNIDFKYARMIKRSCEENSSERSRYFLPNLRSIKR